MKRSEKILSWLAAGILFVGYGQSVWPADITPNQLEALERNPDPETFGASDEGLKAISRFQVKPGFNVSLVAAEPMLGNPVAFAIDNQGVFYTSETYRYRSSVLDIRNYMSWLEDDLALRTVDDRLAMLRKYLGGKADDLATETEVIRRIVDANQDGIADSSEIFADGFNSILDGIASGILPHGKTVYFTNIPGLWMLRDGDGDGYPEYREELSNGYGVRFSLTGHDLHGLIIGPDGRLYFSCGDRGSNVISREGNVLAVPDEGAVFRCELDGSHLELFATGLRNPQELAFDEFGNLFTGDNDSDQGDRERLVYIMEGSDSGWRVGYQHNPLGNGGPWNTEWLWKPHFDGQAAYLLPPIANIDNGPSGLVYNYGTGLPPEYDGAFLVCHFNGDTSRSGITAYRIEPKGAGFSMLENTGANGRPIYDQIVWNCLPTDVDFGPDGALYWTDWNQGWPKSNKGRIYRLSHDDALHQPIVAETHAILRAGFDNLTEERLAELLGHTNMKVRLGAQWELADRGHPSLRTLRKVAYGGANLHARIHAIWAVGQIARKTPYILSDFLALKSAAEPEILVQLARIIGDAGYEIGFHTLESMVFEGNPRVQSIAAIALGKLKQPEAISCLAELITRNSSSDPWLRHAAVMGLAGSASSQLITRYLEEGASPSLQLGFVVALRKQKSPELAAFMNRQNIDPLVLAEAARAINDAPIPEAMPDLANILKRAEWISEFAPLNKSAANESDLAFRSKVEPTLIRGINAAYRVGSPENAADLAKLAASSKVRSSLRVAALEALRDWSIAGVTSARRDRVVGIFRPILTSTDPVTEIKSRPTSPANEALVASAPEIFQSNHDAVILAAAQAAGRLKSKSLAPALVSLVENSGLNGSTRAAALEALHQIGGSELVVALRYAIKASDSALKEAALRIQPSINAGQAITMIRDTLNNGSTSEKQAAFDSLASINSAEAGALLMEALNQVQSGDLPQELHLDVLEAAANSNLKSVQDAFQQFDKSRNKTDWKQTHAVTLFGGNAIRGETIFRENQAVQCRRCHMAKGDGGEVGPVLDGIGSRYTREQILESIADPNATIAQGFETLMVTTIDGSIVAGTRKAETATTLTINTPDEGPVDIDKADIEATETGPSGMPPMLHNALTKRELRDLIEFLATLK